MDALARPDRGERRHRADACIASKPWYIYRNEHVHPNERIKNWHYRTRERPPSLHTPSKSWSRPCVPAASNAAAGTRHPLTQRPS